MLKNKSLIAIATAALVLIVTSATASAAPPASNLDTNDKQDLINSRGSDTTFGMDQKLGNIYNGSEGCVPDTGNAVKALWTTCLPSASSIATENWDHDTVAVHDPQSWGSGKGLAALCAQDAAIPTELARSSRLPVSTDCAGLTGYGYARDGIVPLNWRTLAGSAAVGSTTMTTAQLVGVFSTCTITQWGQLNGNALDTTPIIVWGIQTGSGTYKAFANALGVANANACVTAGDPDGAGPLTSRVAQENDAQQVLSAGLAEAANSIWSMSFGPWQSNSNLRGLSSTTRINGLAASGSTISLGTFLTSRYLFMVTRNVHATDGEKAAQDFVNWACANSTGHTTALSKAYSNQIDSAVLSEGFYRTGDGTGTGGTDKCNRVVTV
jgi:ABC-type phosphate transport system substrate-binding protein